MEHHEAIEMMASERYLLDELEPAMRDAYEEHMFGCIECANDARLGAAFVDHAKIVLPGMTAARATRSTAKQAAKEAGVQRDWFAWLRPAYFRPAFVGPVFASLVAVIGYQNLVVYSALQASATAPRILPAATMLEGATRSGRKVVQADLVLGSTLTVVLPPNTTYAAYKFDFYNSAAKLIWSQTTKGPEGSDDTVTLWLPGGVKQDSYKLAVSGVSATGENFPLQDQFFDLVLKK